MIEIVITIGPWVVVDAAQARQEKQGSAVIGRRELNDFTAMFGIYWNRLEPIRQAFAHVLLKKSLSLDSVGVASQNQSPVAEKRQDEIRRAVVVGQQIPFGIAGLRKIHFVQVAEAQPFAVQFDGDGFRPPLEQLSFDLIF